MENHSLKLRFLPLFLNEENNLGEAIKIAFGFNQLGFFSRVLNFRKKLDAAVQIIKELNSVEFTELDVPSFIELPNIDDISYQARTEIDLVLQRELTDVKEIVDAIVNSVSIAIYEKIYNTPFKEDNRLKELKQRVLNLDYKEAFSLYNKIKYSIIESNKLWTQRFTEERNEDPDVEIAGGDKLDKFNIINIISQMCNIFNVSYHQAWELPYIVVQTTLWMNMTRDGVHSRLTKIKEAKIRSNK